MARRRFLVDQIRNEHAELNGDDARHLDPGPARRSRPTIRNLRWHRSVYLAEIEAAARSEYFPHHRSFRTLPAARASALYAALIKFDRFELMVEKATELGVAAIVPVNAARTEKGLLEAAHKRAERWRRIAHESSQQARRLAPPEIGGAASVR